MEFLYFPAFHGSYGLKILELRHARNLPTKGDGVNVEVVKQPDIFVITPSESEMADALPSDVLCTQPPRLVEIKNGITARFKGRGEKSGGNTTSPSRRNREGGRNYNKGTYSMRQLSLSNKVLKLIHTSENKDKMAKEIAQENKHQSGHPHLLIEELLTENMISTQPQTQPDQQPVALVDNENATAMVLAQENNQHKGDDEVGNSKQPATGLPKRTTPPSTTKKSNTKRPRPPPLKKKPPPPSKKKPPPSTKKKKTPTTKKKKKKKNGPIEI